MLTRRGLITSGAGLVFAGSGLPLATRRATANPLDLPSALPEGARSDAVLDALPGKKPLIKHSYRPPNYETPLEYFRTAITPNDAFSVTISRTFRTSTSGLGRSRSAARAPTAKPNSRSMISNGCRQPNWWPSICARATGADYSSRTFPAWNGATGPWVARVGKGRG